jgi:hypothetical protein
LLFVGFRPNSCDSSPASETTQLERHYHFAFPAARAILCRCTTYLNGVGASSAPPPALKAAAGTGGDGRLPARRCDAWHPQTLPCRTGGMIERSATRCRAGKNGRRIQWRKRAAKSGAPQAGPRTRPHGKAPRYERAARKGRKKTLARRHPG